MTQQTANIENHLSLNTSFIEDPNKETSQSDDSMIDIILEEALAIAISEETSL